MTETLYRFYSDGGQLLYVGITNNPPRRFTEHAGSKDWWNSVSGITMQRYPDRAAVQAAEKRAIAVESPLYNEQLRNPRTHTIPGKIPVYKEIELAWMCGVCRGLIKDGDGYLYVSGKEFYDYEEQCEIHEEKRRKEYGDGIRSRMYDSVSIADIPKLVPWRILHGNCGEDESISSLYWIGVERARTMAQILDWSMHMMEKNWLMSTDWASFIQSRVLRPHNVDA